MSVVTTTYKTIEIEYDEDANKWRFELHGKERKSDTLALAKKAIDTQPKEKADFTPQKALLVDHWGAGEVVTVTAIADSVDYQKNQEYWIKNSEGARKKKSSTELFSSGPANTQLVAEAKALDKEAEKLQTKARAKRKEMAPFNPKEAA